MPEIIRPRNIDTFMQRSGDSYNIKTNTKTI